MNDEIINQLALPAIRQLIELETELLKSIASQLVLFDEIGGSLEWKLKQLERIGLLDKQSIELIAKYAGLTSNEVSQAIKQAGFKSVDYSSLRKANKLGLIGKNNIMLVTYKDEIAKKYQSSSYIISFEKMLEELSTNKLTWESSPLSRTHKQEKLARIESLIQKNADKSFISEYYSKMKNFYS